MTTNPGINLSPSEDLRSKIESAITDVWDHSAQIGHTTDAVMDMIEAHRAPREIPASVRAALDRMCTPLDDSWIKRESYTVKTDMWCMAVIRAHIEGKPLAMPPCATCNGRGIVGGPSYDNPGEGGVPCPDCTSAFPERDTERTAEQQGLFRKFDVQRVDGSGDPGGKHHNCRYYVIDMDHDPYAAPALAAYARACAATHPELSRDLLANITKGSKPYGGDPAEPRDDSDRDNLVTFETDDEVVERIRDAVAEALGDAYDCGRVWSAWFQGNMTDADFSRVAEDSDRVDEISRAVLAALRGTA